MIKPLAIVGPPGSGKTRLIHQIVQLISKEYNEINWREVETLKKEGELSKLLSEPVLVMNVSTVADLNNAELYLRGLRDGEQSDVIILFHCQFQERVATSSIECFYIHDHLFPKRDD